MDYGFKVSQDGYDVSSALDKQLVYSGKFNSLKISSKNSTTLTVSAGATTTKTIAHSLGYAPSHIVFVKSFAYGGTSYWMVDGGALGQVPLVDPNGSNTTLSAPTDDSFFYSYSDSSNLYVIIFNGSGSQKTYSIYYFILIEDNA